MKLLLVLLSVLIASSAAVAPMRMPSKMAPELPPAGALSAPPASSVDVDESAAYGPYGEVWHVRTERKEIALTFDDGPHPPVTQRLLDLLNQLHINVTFFLVGKNVVQAPDVVARMVREGHEVANHTYDDIDLIGHPLGQM